MSTIVLQEGDSTTLEIAQELSQIVISENNNGTAVVEVRDRLEITKTSSDVTQLSITGPDETLVLVEPDSEPLVIEAGTKTVIDRTVNNPEVSFNAIAGDALQRHRFTYIDSDGKAYPWLPSQDSPRVPQIYLAQTTVVAGETVKLISRGILTNPLWNFTRGSFLYVGQNDWFTDDYSQTPADLSWIVGQVTTQPDTLLFDPQLRIL